MQEILWEGIPEGDALPALRALMDWMRAHPGARVRIPGGVYRVTSALARKTQAAVMAGEYGENPENTMFAREFPCETGIAFDGQADTALLAEGVTFLIDGFMEPVAIRNCRGVSVSGLTIDYARRPFSRGAIEAVRIESSETGSGDITVRFADEYPVDERTPMPRHCAYDSRAGHFDLSISVRDRRYLGGNRVRFACGKGLREALAGEAFYVWHCFHYRPAIRVENARDTVLRGVTIYSHCGMGVVGHRCENVLLSGLRVVPAPGERMSTNTDATHFTSCKGRIRFEDCQFEGHGDDATNVHTFYHQLERLSERSARAWVKVRTHSATLDYADAGDEIELAHETTLAPRGRWRVVKSEPDFAANCCRLTFDRPLPGDVERCLLVNIAQQPRLEFVNCTVRNHWARAVLVKTREARIENCRFTASALWAIHVAAEAWWYEGAYSEHIVIRNNIFRDCGFATANARKPVGGVNVEMDVKRHDGRQHRYVEITGNDFCLPHAVHAIRVADTQRALLANNRFAAQLGEPVAVENCGNVEM